MLKLLKEVKQKLKLLQPGGKFNQLVNDPNFNAANIMSGVDSDEDLGDVASEAMAIRGKSKGPAVKKTKKKP